MKKAITLLIVFPLLFTIIRPVIAAPDIVKIGSDFVIALTKKDEEQARGYLASNVVIPEIREDTPIKIITGLPSPEENKSVSVAYFDEGNNTVERIAFIWELTFEKDKITDIKVVYDGSNPFMNESKIKKEYESKNKTKILKIYEFPFEVTHVDGSIEYNVLVLNYRNAQTNLRIKVKRNKTDLDKFEGEYYTLDNGMKVLYQPNKQLLFQYGDLLYTIRLESATNSNNALENLLKVANSMKLMA